ncbi:hypothetical protein ACJMK2_011963 [Sinanodonta woodiana]|uniref:Uncharacterized protein n=1 Tax=Sinanodonta woodiana TaxID=1069815 RepID=A0ABD3V7U1_SINWO
MELRIVYILGTIVVMFHISEARPYLTDTTEADSEQDTIIEITAADEMPKYLNTRNLSAFQYPNHNSMEKIAEEDKVNQKLLVPKSATAHDRRVKRQSKQIQLCHRRSGTALIQIACKTLKKM